jgi:hypothetical protein
MKPYPGAYMMVDDREALVLEEGGREVVEAMVMTAMRRTTWRHPLLQSSIASMRR